MSAPDPVQPDLAAALTHQEIAALNSRKVALKAGHTSYLASHPEVKNMLNDFLSQVLLSRPDDVFSFAADHFAELSPADAEVVGKAGYCPVVVCGPMGVGKGTLLNLLMKAFPGRFARSVSHTTRPMRPGEVDGEDYHFTTRDKMQQEIEDGKFIEFMDVRGHLYGTSFTSVSSVRSSGAICLLDASVPFVKSLRSSRTSRGFSPRYLFIAPPNLETLSDRLWEKIDARAEEKRIVLRSGGSAAAAEAAPDSTLDDFDAPPQQQPSSSGDDFNQDSVGGGGGVEDVDATVARIMGVAGAEVAYGAGKGNFDAVVVNEVLEDAFVELKGVMEGWFPHLKGGGEEKEEAKGEAKGEEKSSRK